MLCVIVLLWANFEFLSGKDGIYIYGVRSIFFHIFYGNLQQLTVGSDVSELCKMIIELLIIKYLQINF